jgi:hypothetical protein
MPGGVIDIAIAKDGSVTKVCRGAIADELFEPGPEPSA